MGSNGLNAGDRAGGEEAWSGARILCEALVREGVEVLFGIPGGAIMPFYHALADYRGRLRHVLCRHEQGAGHAAEGYAAASGKVGVCIATSGPGATNLVTPLANAWMDGTPLVAITGQVPTPLLGTDAFQETDIIGITMPITKHGIQVTRPEQIPAAVREAFRVATSGRPGPVVLDIAKDAQQGFAVPVWPDTPGVAAADPVQEIGELLARAAMLLVSSSRPLILAGHGVIQAGAAVELRTLAEETGVPVVTTLLGKGVLPEDHPLCLGMAGMHGWVHVNRAIQAADLVLNIGSRFDDRVTGKAATFAPKARIIHIDIDPAQIGKVVRADLGIVADAREAIRELLVRVRELLLADQPGPNGQRRREAWLHEIDALRLRHGRGRMYRTTPRTSPLMPHDVYGAFNAVAARSSRPFRVVTDVGQHQMWAA
ncbi:MAG TPA: thiamine pyrophosphate-binding protein, partial [Longimicrobiales bacterium]|nr:thiamine pyrophosphate-binding protein [Longimicrobiales bacterium]